MKPKEFHSLADVHPDDVLTPKIAAALIQRKAGYIRAQIRDGELAARDRGGWLIKGRDYLEWLDSAPKSTDLENLEPEAPPILTDNGASTSREKVSARMANLSLQSGIASR